MLSIASRTGERTSAPRPSRALFICTGNAARSQIAEAWANALAGDLLEAYSAGTSLRGIDPRAVQVMAEAGIDISSQRSKSIAELIHAPFELVVTVCGAAQEACPTFPGEVRHVHAGLDDPPSVAASAAGDPEALAVYRRIRDEIRSFVEDLRNELRQEERAK